MLSPPPSRSVKSSSRIAIVIQTTRVRDRLDLVRPPLKSEHLRVLASVSHAAPRSSHALADPCLLPAIPKFVSETAFAPRTGIAGAVPWGVVSRKQQCRELAEPVLEALLAVKRGASRRGKLVSRGQLCASAKMTHAITIRPAISQTIRVIRACLIARVPYAMSKRSVCIRAGSTSSSIRADSAASIIGSGPQMKY